MKFNSSLLSQASGSVAGSTYSRNRGGAYIRNRSKPTNPNTPAQQAVRNALTVSSNLYANSLTSAQQAGWLAFANSNPVINKIGNSTKLSALQMFNYVNIPLITMGGSAAAELTAPPAGTLLDGLQWGPTLAETDGVFTIDVLNVEGFAIGDVLFFYCSTPCSSGRTPVNQPQGLITSVTLAAVPTVPNNYIHVFPDPFAGSRGTGTPVLIRGYWVRGANRANPTTAQIVAG